MDRIAVSLATQGFTVLNINYRLSPKHTHPAPIKDLEMAIRFFKANSNKFKLNKDKIGLWGYSSGGHTVSYYALTRAKDSNLSVNAVVSGGAPYDFTWYPRDPNLKKYIGQYRDEALFAYEKAGATTKVNSSAPPFFLYHAKNDDIVEFHQMPSFEADLKLNEIPVKTYTVNFWGHVGTFLFSRKAIEKGVNFLIKHLK